MIPRIDNESLLIFAELLLPKISEERKYVTLRFQMHLKKSIDLSFDYRNFDSMRKSCRKICLLLLAEVSLFKSFQLKIIGLILYFMNMVECIQVFGEIFLNTTPQHNLPF